MAEVHPPTPEVTRLLRLAAEGTQAAFDELVSVVYGELLKIAQRRMAEERRGHSLLASDLVHEAYLRLAPGLDRGSFHDRAHFYCAAATAMRRVLIDHARRRRSRKRGAGRERVPLSAVQAELKDGSDPDETLALDEAVARLEEWDARLARVVQLRLFAGLGVEETAEVLGVAPRTVKRDWQFARAWLVDALASG